MIEVLHLYLCKSTVNINVNNYVNYVDTLNTSRYSSYIETQTTNENTMKGLYGSAIQLIDQLATMRMAIDGLKDKGAGRILLRTDETIGDSYKYANVRPTAYVQFLEGEMKDIQKDLKVIQEEIKRKLSNK